MRNRFDLGGKAALITGGSGALGRAIAQALADHGARVILLGRSAEKLHHAARLIHERGGAVDFVTGDVTSEASFAQALAKVGQVDVLVNAAGTILPANPTSLDLDVAATRLIMDVNWMGTVVPSLLTARQFAERGSGVIVNVAAMTSLQPLTQNFAYAASRAALISVTRWLAVHLARRYSPRIRVNAVAVGAFLTETNRELLVDPNSGLPTEAGRAVLARTPMGRFGEPDDLGGAVVFLASDAARFVTGAVLPVDGGYSAEEG
ncbi:MAG: SDR family oxidoreductase [Anaerolineae bacterium]|nr:SDR family oxidoreductase [Anaerolineae bacterium]